MEPCNLPYIPARLHTNERPAIEEFYIGEYLYRRCPIDKIEDCFDRINLRDISVNRQGNPNSPISESKDVLFNTRPDLDVEIFEEAVIPFVIRELTEEKKYIKIVEVEGFDGNSNVAVFASTITLRHDKLPCNYSHTVFDFFYKGEIVTEENYKTTLGKKGSGHSKLRTACKFEIYKMMIKKEIWINWPTK